MTNKPDKAKIKSIMNRLRYTKDIILSSHATEHLKDQPITEQEIKEAIWNPVKLVFVEEQDAEIGEKYKLIFHQSGKYDFVIVVLFSDDYLKVITVRKQNKKRLRLTERWSKRVIGR